MDACEHLQVKAISVLFGGDRAPENVAAYAHKACTGIAAAAASAAAMPHSRQLAEAGADAVFSGATMSISLDVAFLFVCGFMVMFMQLGFAALCAGCVRVKNVTNTLLMNAVDCCVAGVCFYLLGYGVAFGTGADGAGNAFIGTGDFALSASAQNGLKWHLWLFHWAVVSAVVTIVAGAVAERCKMEGYLIYTVAMSTLVYPVAAHWLWADAGWLSILNEKPLFGIGMVDFAGCSVVHFVGGLTACIAAAACGPPVGRYLPSGGAAPGWRGHSHTLVVLGTFILWTGWYGFNSGSALQVSTVTSASIVGRAAVVTTLGGCAGGVAALLATFAATRAWDLPATCNGILCGLVSITAGAPVFEPWAALITAPVATLAFAQLERLVLRAGVADTVSATAMHGGVGCLGALFVGVLAKGDYVLQLLGKNEGDFEGAGTHKGLFYGGNGKLLGAAAVGLLAIGAWVAACMVPLFAALRRAGLLRADAHAQAVGLDEAMHGGPAYFYGDAALESDGACGSVGATGRHDDDAQPSAARKRAVAAEPVDPDTIPAAAEP